MSKRIPKMRKLAMACAGLAFSWMTPNAAGTTGVSVDESQSIITVTVDEGESKTFAELAGSNIISLMNATGAKYYGYHLEKRGKGELIMSTDLRNWCGQPRVWEGTMVNKVKFGIGIDSKYWPTYVYADATLALNPTHGTNNRINWISGNGAAGHYGVLECVVTGSSYIRDVFPNNINLMWDSTIAVQTKGYAQSVFEKALILNSHPLTLTGKGGTAEHNCIFSGCTITPGTGAKIVLDDMMRLSLRQKVNLGASGTFELKGSGSLELWGSPDAPGVVDSSGWKIVANSGSTGCFGGTFFGFPSFVRSANAWNGPMELQRDTVFKMNGDYYHASAATRYGLLTVNGKISGAGGISATGRTEANRFGYLMLGNAANDFQGGVQMTDVTLGLTSATALPAAGKAAQFTDASLQILEPAAAQPSVVTFPELDFTVTAGKTSEIGSKLDTLADGATVVGSTPKVTKRGAGTLDSKAALAANEINLEGGVLKLPNAAARAAGVRRMNAGLYSGYERLGISDSPFKQAYQNGKYLTLCLTNHVALSPEIYYLPANYYPAGDNAWGEHYYQIFNSWDGYIWNNTDQVKTWKVVDTCNSIQRLTIGGTENQYAMEADRISPWTDGISDAYAPQIYTVTLQPGPNRFIVRTYDRFAYKNFQHGSVRVKGLTNWTDAHGLMYTEKLDSVDMNDYHPFIDSGDGTLFTRVADVSVPAVAVVRGNGGTLDLQDGSLTATAVEGKPVVTGGTLNVTGTWTLTAAQVTDASYAASGLSLGGAVTLVISDDELAGIKPKGRGYLLASGFSGKQPVLGANLAEAGWELVLENGDLRLCRPTGLAIIFR